MPRKSTRDSAISSSPDGSTPQGKKRNYNPKSLENLPPKKEAIATSMKLPQSTRDLARMIGDGDMTAGVERLFAILPVFNQCKLILQLIAEKPEKAIELHDQIESVLLELETLEIDRVHEESITEGVS